MISGGTYAMRVLGALLFSTSCLLSVGAANATLVDRGGGMVYDTNTNLTWLQDWNLAKTTGWDADGLMFWTDALAWVDQLEVGGYTDWRLPTNLPDPGPCPCLANELQNIWYGELRNISLSINPGPFTNLGSFGGGYWTSTEAYAPGLVFAFNATVVDSGMKVVDTTLYDRRAVAVRDGDVAFVPEPTSLALALLALGAATLNLRRRAR
jgi:hypothetical protein